MRTRLEEGKMYKEITVDKNQKQEDNWTNIKGDTLQSYIIFKCSATAILR